MATKNKQWKVIVESNPGFCGVDAGGVQFAHGEAIVESQRLADWFKKHKGYKVAEVKAPAANTAKKDPVNDKAPANDNAGDKADQ